MPEIPDLVIDSKLETQFLPDCSVRTAHTYREPDPNLEPDWPFGWNIGGDKANSEVERMGAFGWKNALKESPLPSCGLSSKLISRDETQELITTVSLRR